MNHEVHDILKQNKQKKLNTTLLLFKCNTIYFYLKVQGTKIISTMYFGGKGWTPITIDPCYDPSRIELILIVRHNLVKNISSLLFLN